MKKGLPSGKPLNWWSWRDLNPTSKLLLLNYMLLLFLLCKVLVLLFVLLLAGMTINSYGFL